MAAAAAGPLLPRSAAPIPLHHAKMVAAAQALPARMYAHMPQIFHRVLDGVAVCCSTSSYPMLVEQWYLPSLGLKAFVLQHHAETPNLQEHMT